MCAISGVQLTPAIIDYPRTAVEQQYAARVNVGHYLSVVFIKIYRPESDAV